MRTLTVDVECYENYFLVGFKDHEEDRYVAIESFNDSPLDRKRLLTIMSNNLTIGFNSMNYDLPMISAALKGYNTSQLKRLSDKIVTTGIPHWKTYKDFKLKDYKFNHIDIKEPTFGVMVSLKLYGARLNAPKLQDLPIEPDAIITEDDLEDMRTYNENDLDTTWLLYKEQSSGFELREKMTGELGIDVRSKSDAQIAEVIFRKELTEKGVEVNKNTLPNNYSFKFNVPDWVEFKDTELQKQLQAVRQCVFKLSDKNAVVLPKEISKPIKYRGAKYQFGIGGLHSQEKRQHIVKKEGQHIVDIDVASMYPNIIINNKSYPKHLTRIFLSVYKGIVDKRLHAKAEMQRLKKERDKGGYTDEQLAELNAKIDKYETTQGILKICANGSYGKFGSQYSFLFSPDLMIDTTLTGQLALLMLIEMLEESGSKIMSANTDGVVVVTEDLESVRLTYKWWEFVTGLTLEETHYEAVYWRDVNNYFAITTDGKVKSKGCFAKPSIAKNVEHYIVYESVINYLKDGVPIEKSILECSDITKFISTRTVKGGAVWNAEYLGKVVRWYYSKNGNTIHYKSNNNKVAKSDNAKPLMELCDSVPEDLDYKIYIDLAKSTLVDLGL